ncbi:FAD:protein FMN transferase [Nocardioides bruguierae]|uniref:FAD:protein FMN transferase n=1 Tax=Nocardioides bruguierae TaxID=2945102 RepID=UPI0027DFF4B9|nr:FAD:protein FMN transferase [Nocardioides bruguierae]
MTTTPAPQHSHQPFAQPAPAAPAGPPTWRANEQVMGMPISLALRGREAGTEAGHQAWREAVHELRWADQVFSTWKADSWISRLDRREVTLAECPAEVADVLDLGERARVSTGGRFDVQRFGRLDPTGVVKGWAVERAVRPLLELADTDLCLSAGGDMVCRVRDPQRPGWRIGIEDPADPSRVKVVLTLRDGALATSGLSRRGAHLVDPRTGAVPASLGSVTVVAESLTWADIDATAGFVADAAAPAWLTERARRGVVIWRDGTVEPYGC